MATWDHTHPYPKQQVVFTIGETITVPFYNPSGEQATVSIVYNGTTLASATSSGTYVTIDTSASAVKSALYGQMPYDRRGLYCDQVISNGTVTNTMGNGFLYYVNDNECMPTVGSLTYQDITSAVVAITGDNQKPVSGKSTIQFTASNVQTKYSATIYNMYVRIRGYSYSTTMTGSGTTYTGTLSNWSTSNSYVYADLYVIDSRHLQSITTVMIPVLPYYSPTAVITLRRQDNYYSPTTIKCDANYASLNGGNSVTITYACTKEGDSTASITGTLQDNVAVTETLDNQYAWSVLFTVTDALGTVSTFTRSVGVGAPLIYFDNLNTAIGIGKFPSSQQVVDIADEWSVNANSEININAPVRSDTMPYAFRTNGGQVWGNAQIGYCRIATIRYKEQPPSTGPAGTPQNFYCTYRFTVNSTRSRDMHFTVMFNPAGWGSLPIFRYFVDAGNGTYQQMAFLRRNGSGDWSDTYDIYVYTNGANDNFTVHTYSNEYAEDYMEITYSDDFILNANRPDAGTYVEYATETYLQYLKDYTTSGTATFSSSSQIVSNGKNNTFAYMPYSFNTSYSSGNTGYLRIAQITITGTYPTSGICFAVQRLIDMKPIMLYVRFANENTTDPSTCELKFDDLNGTYVTSPFVAFAYKEATSVWGIYVYKVSATDSISVTTYVSPYMQARCNITYSEARLASVPSGTVVATELSAWTCLHSGMPGTPTLYNCTGTLSTNIFRMWEKANKDEYALEVRLRITNFARTGANPRVIISTNARPSTAFYHYVGFRTDGNDGKYLVPEPIQMTLAVDGTLNLQCLETYWNITSGGSLWLVIPHTVIAYSY